MRDLRPCNFIVLSKHASPPTKWGVAIMICALLLALITPLLLTITAVTNNVLIGYATIASIAFVLPVAAGLFLVGVIVLLAPRSRKSSEVEKTGPNSSL